MNEKENAFLNVNCQDKNGQTALMLSILEGHIDTVDILIGHNCNLDTQDDEGCTALMLAAYKGYIDVVNTLLTHKCRIDLQDIDGLSVLMYAVGFNRKDILLTRY